ncbi:WAT1-related protein [Dichanthelium oligosanthes]|uniref:WAT1-related protein n=1 Tax=Dichanthelium oligosanthes TaxID=888268 RepID=A0A1E5V040_9POAL|nr:WAT1-related protein [Dichanthelium oligosanthes]
MATTMGGKGRKRRPYAVGVAIQVIYAATIVISKASFDQGLSVFVYILYRQAAASLLLLPMAILLERRNAPPMSFRLLLKMFLYALFNTLGTCLYNTSLKYTSATAAAAICSSIPVITFFLALLLRMEAMKLRSSPGMAKAAGMTLCLAGVLVIALYAGPLLNPLNRHRVLADHGNKHAAAAHGVVSKGLWITGTFLMLLACVAWSLWIVFQVNQFLLIIIIMRVWIFFFFSPHCVWGFIDTNVQCRGCC